MLRNHTLGSSPSAVSIVAILCRRLVETYLCLVSAWDLSALVRCVLHSAACSAAVLALSQPRGSIHVHDVSYQPLLLRILAVAVYGLLPTLASQQMCNYSSVREDLSVAGAEQGYRFPGNTLLRRWWRWIVPLPPSGEFALVGRPLMVQCSGVPGESLQFEGLCMHVMVEHSNPKQSPGPTPIPIRQWWNKPPCTETVRYVSSKTVCLTPANLS